MKCSCGKTIKLSDKRMIAHYVRGKKTIDVKCSCEKTYKVRIFLNVETHIDGYDEVIDVEDE